MLRRAPSIGGALQINSVSKSNVFCFCCTRFMLPNSPRDGTKLFLTSMDI